MNDQEADALGLHQGEEISDAAAASLYLKCIWAGFRPAMTILAVAWLAGEPVSWSMMLLLYYVGRIYYSNALQGVRNQFNEYRFRCTQKVFEAAGTAMSAQEVAKSDPEPENALIH